MAQAPWIPANYPRDQLPGRGGKRNRNGGGNGGNKGSFQDEIAQGKVPGNAGKDYPVNSLAAWRKPPGYENIELAPEDLIPANYPRDQLPGRGGKRNRNGGGNKNRNGNGNGNQKRPSSSSASESYCPGGALQECIRFCPSDESGTEFSSCVTNCGNQCPA